MAPPEGEIVCCHVPPVWYKSPQSVTTVTQSVKMSLRFNLKSRAEFGGSVSTELFPRMWGLIHRPLYLAAPPRGPVWEHSKHVAAFAFRHNVLHRDFPNGAIRRGRLKNKFHVGISMTGVFISCLLRPYLHFKCAPIPRLLRQWR